MSSARLTLLGSGLGIPDADRGPTHLLWQSAAGDWLIDCGGETFRRLLAAGCNPVDLRAIILTHSHLDHIGGLPTLLFSLALAGRRAALPIYGPPPTLELVDGLIAHAGLGAHCPPLDWRPVEPAQLIAVPGAAPLATAATAHSRLCLALRAADGDQQWCYSADSGPSAAVRELARGTELLIHEAAAATAEEHHSTPAQVGALAAELAVRRLVLVHFSPRWTMPAAQALADVSAAGYHGAAVIGTDGMVIAAEQR